MVNRLIREGVKRKINYFCKFFAKGGGRPKFFGIKIIVPKLYLKLEFDTEDRVLFLNNFVWVSEKMITCSF